MLNIFKKKAEEVIIEGAENAVVNTPAEPGNNRNKIVAAAIALGLAIVGTVVGLAVTAHRDDADDEMRIPDMDEPIEVTDEMLEEVIE